ncbi:MAG: 3'-5' exoribonuclease, partial [Acidobacteriota bacterium]
CHATFDEPILRNAYIALGLDVPWTRHQVFDLRTLLYLAPTEIEADRGPRHVALQDAMYMARQAGAALGRQEAVRRFLEVWKSPVSAPKEPTTGDSKCQP